MDCIKILLVDDEAMVRRGLRMRLGLEADMIVVGEACDGSEALNDIRAFEPDVILIDYQMPVLNGLETIRTARECGCNCAFVMLSSNTSPILKSAAVDAGATAFIGKHDSDAALLAAIRQAAVQPVETKPAE